MSDWFCIDGNECDKCDNTFQCWLSSYLINKEKTEDGYCDYLEQCKESTEFYQFITSMEAKNDE